MLVSPFVLGWVVVGFLASSFVFSAFARSLRTVGWLAFSAGCLSLVPYYLFTRQSVVEFGLAAGGVVFGLLVATHITRKHGTIDRITLMVVVAGLTFLAFNTVAVIQSALIQVVATQTVTVLELLGFTPTLVEETTGVLIVFDSTPTPVQTRLVTACTGIGSMAAFLALASVLDAPYKDRALVALAATGLIHLLNIARNAFIAGSYAGQWLHVAPGLVETVFGSGGRLVSYYVADRVVSQFLSVVALGLMSYIVLAVVSETDEIESEIRSLVAETRRTLLSDD